MGRLLAMEDPPTAILAESDEMAFGAIAALRRAQVPGSANMSIVGIDDHELSPLFDLTTVRQPVFEQGALAARLLIRALENPSGEISEQVVPTTLVIRSSTSPPG